MYTIEQAYPLIEDFEDSYYVRAELIGMVEEGQIDRETAQATYRQWVSARLEIARPARSQGP